MLAQPVGRPGRVFVMLLPLLLTLGGLRLCMLSPFDFSGRKMTNADVPQWTVSIDYLLLGLPFVILGLVGCRTIWRRTALLFRIDWFHASLGFAGVVPTVIALFLVGENRWSQFSYNWESSGSATDSIYSMLTTFLLAGSWAAINAIFLFLYAAGIVSEGSGKYDKRPDETDAVGSLLDEMKGARTG